MSSNLKLVMWNSGGVRNSADSTPLKMGFFDKEFTSSNFSVAAFLETHHKSERDFPDLLRQYETHYKIVHTPTPPNFTHAGIIVLVHHRHLAGNDTNSR